MMYPEFNPIMPKGYHHAITMVRWTGHGHLITYDVWSDAGYSEQRCACVLNDRVKWDQIIWAETAPEHVKEFRAQKVERVRLKPMRRRHW